MVKERLKNNWEHYLQIYTDGAQDPKTGKSGFAFYIPDLETEKLKRLSEGVSVYNRANSYNMGTTVGRRGQAEEGSHMLRLSLSPNDTERKHVRGPTRPCGGAVGSVV